MSGSASDYIPRYCTYRYLCLYCKFAQTSFSWHYMYLVRSYLPNLLNFLKYLRHYILADQRAIDPCTGHVHVRVNFMYLLTYQ